MLVGTREPQSYPVTSSRPRCYSNLNRASALSMPFREWTVLSPVAVTVLGPMRLLGSSFTRHCQQPRQRTIRLFLLVKREGSHHHRVARVSFFDNSGMRRKRQCVMSECITAGNHGKSKVRSVSLLAETCRSRTSFSSERCDLIPTLTTELTGGRIDGFRRRSVIAMSCARRLVPMDIR